MMKITYGVDGLSETHQAVFPAEVECVHCTGLARPAVNIIEGYAQEDEYVCNLHDNEGGEGGDYWLHDVAAFQIYLCRGCLKPTTLYNQA